MKRSKEPPRIRVEQLVVHDATRRLRKIWELLEAEYRRWSNKARGGWMRFRP